MLLAIGTAANEHNVGRLCIEIGGVFHTNDLNGDTTPLQTLLKHTNVPVVAVQVKKCWEQMSNNQRLHINGRNNRIASNRQT